MPSSTVRTTSAAAKPSLGLFARLHSIKIGGSNASQATKIKRRDLSYIIRNLATLVGNGLSLPKALGTIARERSLRKYASQLEVIRRRVETGESFSSALAQFPETFTEVMINQIHVGERAGTLAATLLRLTEQLDSADNLKARVLKKLSYPIVLVVVGGLAVTFMLLFVIPVFEKTYAGSGVPLPMITQVMIYGGDFLSSYGIVLVFLAVAGAIGYRYARNNPIAARKMDAWLLRTPVVGDWFRDMAVLQFMEVLGNLLEAGFTVADALRVSAGSVTNRAVRHSVGELHSAVVRGERFSLELDRHDELFPPIVNQLVIVGEKTGTLAKATAEIRNHLQRQIERTTNVMVGTIEPVLTISLAAMIGCILLAIYLPMFDMIGAMNPPTGK